MGHHGRAPGPWTGLRAPPRRRMLGAMKIALVSPYPDITNYGLRTLSAVLRRAGHATQVVCMPDFTGDGATSHARLGEERYPPDVVARFLEVVEGAALVGFSVMTLAGSGTLSSGYAASKWIRVGKV